MQRIYHTWDKWECYPAGFYETKPPRKDLTSDDCKRAYADFLSDIPRFKSALVGVTTQWINSCEHYLTNENMNRIAWLGQAAMCFETRIPSVFCGGYQLLTDGQKITADEAALEALNAWLELRGEPAASMEVALGKTQANLY